jgi:hypothetical protein
VSEALGNRPSPAQLLVLHAALDEPPPALAAWRRWRAATGFDDADGGTARLLPLVYRNLGPDSFEAEDSRRLRDAYRESWRRNQLLFRRAAEAVVLLERAGIETLVLKGASLAALAYRDAGARPMDDVDVLVPLVRARGAIEALGAAGWAPAHDDPAARTEVHHSLGYSGAGGGELDLHWFSLWQPASDEALWRAALPFELAGTATRAPCAADQLLLTCVHGAPWSPMPPFRWIADAIAVIRSAGDALDWDRLAAEAERRRLTVALGAALAYLCEEFDAPVPPSVLSRLESVTAPRHERAAFRASCEPDRPSRTLRMAWDRYRRLRDLDTGAPPPSSFPSFARRFWGLDSAWKLPLHGARSLYRR